MNLVEASQILALMLKLEPNSPYRETFDESAEVYAKVANDEPLFKGEDGPLKTAALFVSVAWFESRFRKGAIGDHGQSVCEFQIGVSNLRNLGTTKDEILQNTEVCTRAARKMMAISFGVCRGKDVLYALSHYAAGGEKCGGEKGQGERESKHRMLKADFIYKKLRAMKAVKPD